MKQKFASWAWYLLYYNLLVVVWGALVRATGSGAGCGDHWPTCNGEVMPVAPSIATMIEYTHRLMSGLDGLIVIGFVWWAFRVFEKGHLVRLAALWSLGLTISEGAIGAAIVKLGHVATNASTWRGLTLGLHLINTLLLIAALGLMAWFAKERPARPALSVNLKTTIRWALIGMLVVGAMGAITALGDTLFKVDSLAAGMQQDLDPNSHPFVKMRVLHPVLAVLFAALLAWMGAKVAGDENAGPTLEGLGRGLLMMTFLQTSIGVLNLMMLAPIWLQLLHLLSADLLWLVLVLLAVELWG